MSGRTRVTLQAAMVGGVVVVALHAAADATRAAVPGANGKIAFVSSRDGNSEVYAMNADGTAPTNLTHNAFSDVSPAWSPDGARIAFASNRDGTWRIYVMNGDGSDARPLTPGPWDRDPTWSPDGSQILFHRSLDTGSFVYVVSSSGGADRELAHSNIEIRASWSPDGRRIAYTSALERPWRIYTIAPDGSDRRLVPTADEAFAPNWSPDGQRLAFSSRRAGTSDIYSITPDGGTETRVTSSGDDELRPSWSPDGTKIAYVTAAGALKVVRSDGSGEVTLTSSASSFLGAPDWQPATDVTARATGPASAVVGRRVTYTIRITNASVRPAANVRAQLTFAGPARVVARTASAGSCLGTASVTCAVGDLGAGGVARLTVTVAPRRSGTIILRVTARSSTPEATAADNNASARTTVRARR